MSAGMFFFHAAATTEIYTLSLHDALPIWSRSLENDDRRPEADVLEEPLRVGDLHPDAAVRHAEWLFEHRSEEHTSELQSRENLVCRLLLEKKKPRPINTFIVYHQFLSSTT